MSAPSLTDLIEIFDLTVGRPSTEKERAAIAALCDVVGDDQSKMLAAMQAQLMAMLSTASGREALAKDKTTEIENILWAASDEAALRITTACEEVGKIEGTLRGATSEVVNRSISAINAATAKAQEVITVTAESAAKNAATAAQAEGSAALRDAVTDAARKLNEGVLSVRIAKEQNELEKLKRATARTAWINTALGFACGAALTYGVAVALISDTRAELKFIEGQPSGKTMLALMRANAGKPGVCASIRGPQAGLGTFKSNDGVQRCTWTFDFP